ncbi:MAG: 6-phosphogluconolactonase [Gemmatimonadales bacterium]
MTRRRVVGEVILVEDGAALAQMAARRIAAFLREAVDARGSASVLLAGGNTPTPAYRLLASPPLVTAVPWARTTVFFGDERCVPPEDPASNFRAATEALLSRVPLGRGQVHRMEAERADRDQAARDYERLLPRLPDLVMLGMGPEGHVASLFPGSAALGEELRRVVVVETPKPPPFRLTITPPVIAAARQVLVLVAGEDKAEAVARTLEGDEPPEVFPARLAARGIWIVTRDAARGLSRRN